MFLVCFGHRSRARLRSEYSIVTISLQLWQKEAVELFGFYLLQIQYTHCTSNQFLLSCLTDRLSDLIYVGNLGQLSLPSIQGT